MNEFMTRDLTYGKPMKLILQFRHTRSVRIFISAVL